MPPVVAGLLYHQRKFSSWGLGLLSQIALRIARALCILFGLSLVFFVIAHLTPGGICSLYPQRSLPACSASMGLKETLPQQYAHWIGGYLHGDLGQSATGQSILSVVLGALPITALLVFASYVFLLAVTLIGTLLPPRAFRLPIVKSLRTAGVIGLSLPTFWLALMLIYVLTVHWRILPPGQVDDANIPSFWSHAWFVALSSTPRMVLVNLIKHLILPAAALAVIVIVVDQALPWGLERILRHGGIRTVNRQGIRRKGGIFVDVLGGGLLASFSGIRMFLASLITGFVIVETVFSYDGLGKLFQSSLGGHEYAVVLGLLMLGALALVLVDLVAALLLTLIPPLHFDRERQHS